MFNTVTYYNPQRFIPHTNPLPNAIAYQNMSALVNELQSVIMKQQGIINTLSSQVQHFELQQTLLRSKPMLKKMDSGKISEIDSLSETTEESYSGVMEAAPETRAPQIRRRNGFKNQDNSIRTKCEEDTNTPSSSEGIFAKTSRSQISNSSSSKAKHLWVNYGRRILEYAIHETDGPLQERVKQYVGKMNSKKDFEKAFQSQESDSEDEKEFKKVLGKLALQFVRHRASPTFESSKYKQEMISQRHTVAAWIERLMGI